MKKSFTWWAGWVVLWPFRVIFLAIVLLGASLMPSSFYAILNIKEEKNPDNWRLDL
jgi:hypothetical protein